MVTSESEGKRVLLDAARLINTHGWVQGFNMSEDGYCAGGAIIEALGLPQYADWDAQHRGAYLRATLPLVEHLCKLGERSIVQWNDTPGRTKDEVVSVLRGVAFNYDFD